MSEDYAIRRVRPKVEVEAVRHDGSRDCYEFILEWMKKVKFVPSINGDVQFRCPLILFPDSYSVSDRLLTVGPGDWVIRNVLPGSPSFDVVSNGAFQLLYKFISI